MTKSTKFYSFKCDEILKKSFNPIVYFLNLFFNQKKNIKKNKIVFNKKFNEILKETKNIDIKNELIRTKSIIAALLNHFWKDSLYDKLDAKGRYENTLFALKELLKAISLINPILLIIKDFQWIDKDSKNFFQMFVRNVEYFPILILIESRYKDNGLSHSLNINSLQENRIVINNFNRSESNKYLKKYFKLNKIPVPTISFILDKTEGNPFFINQILIYMQENSIINKNAEIEETNNIIPGTINSLILSRIDRLLFKLKNIIMIASVLGNEFDALLLKNVSEEKETKKYLTEGIVELIWSLSSDINYSFNQILFREVAYQMQLKETLRKHHFKAAEEIKNLYSQNIEMYYEDIANHYEKSEKYKKSCIYYEKAAEILKSNYENEKAIELYLKVIKYYKKRDHRYLKILENLGKIYHIIGNWDKAEDIYNKFYELASYLNDGNKISVALRSLGAIMLFKGNYQKANSFFLQSLRISLKSNNNYNISSVLANMGVINLRKGIYKKALENFRRSLTYAKKSKNKSLISNILSNLGMLSGLKGEYEEALKYFKKRLKIAKSENNRYDLSGTLGNIGIVYMKTGKFSKAMKYFNDDLILLKEFGRKKEISNTINNIGMIFFFQRKYDEALKYYNKRLSISNELNDYDGKSKVLSTIGELYYFKKKYQKAIKYHIKDLTISTKLGNNIRIYSALKNLALVYKELGDYNNTVKYYNSAIKLSKMLKSENKYIEGKFDLIEYIYNYKKTVDKKDILDLKKIAEKIKDNTILLKIKIFNINIKYKRNKVKAFKILKLISHYETIETEALIYYEIFKILL